MDELITELGIVIAQQASLRSFALLLRKEMLTIL